MYYDDDDDFGHIYIDDLLEPAPHHLLPPPPPPPPPIVPFAAAPDPTPDAVLDDVDEDEILYGAPRSAPVDPTSSRPPVPSVAPLAAEDGGEDDDWLFGPVPDNVEAPDTWDDDEVTSIARPSSAPPAPAEPRVLEGEDAGVMSVHAYGFGGVAIPGVGVVPDPFETPEIPGISARVSSPGYQGVGFGGGGAFESNNWDSDSEDDLRIVLNDGSPVLPIRGGVGSGGDEDGGESHHLAAMEEEDEAWGEESHHLAAEGERMEELEAGERDIAAVTAADWGFHQQHHSMYKYVTPGAESLPGAPTVGSDGGPGQILAPSTWGPSAGRGRGDWRYTGGRGILNARRSINSGYGLPNRPNNSSWRAFGNEQEFSLPPHKTAVDIDIESFEDKSWRHPGVNISDYFNFGLDEDTWKDYCKQLEQFRLEATMHRKIRVYESGRSEQDYDPDLPPELAAAAVHHNSSSDNPHNIKVENGLDLSGKGRVVGCIQPSVPIGRAIPVECGFAEHFPSIETRTPRIRDQDGIIEIILQEDDSRMSNGASGQLEELKRGNFKGASDFEEDDRKSGPFGTHRGGRLPQGTSCGRHSSMSRAHSVDAMFSEGLQIDGRDTDRHEKLVGGKEGEQISKTSPARAVSSRWELSMESRENELDDRLDLRNIIEVEGEDAASDFRMSGEILADDSLVRSARKPRLSSKIVIPAMQDNGDGDDLRTHIENSKAKSGSSMDRRRQGSEEIVRDGQRRIGDLGKHRKEEEMSYRRNNNYRRSGRQGEDINRIASGGMDTMYRPYPYRVWDANSAHHVRDRSQGFERLRESHARQRREDDVYSRRAKGEDARREHSGKAGSRNKNKVKLGDRNGRDGHMHLKRRVNGGDWRSHSREVGPRQGKGEDPSTNRRENIDDVHANRQKVEEHSRREKIDSGDALHNYRPNVNSSRKERERDGDSDHRREDDAIMRDIRLRRDIEDKTMEKNADNMDDTRSMLSDKGKQLKDRRQHNEPFNWADRTGEGNGSQHARKDPHPHENQSSQERSSRNEKLSSCSDRISIASDSQQMHRGRERENTWKSKDIEVRTEIVQGLGKRRHEDHDTRRTEKVVLKGNSDQESSSLKAHSKVADLNLSTETEVSQLHHLSAEEGEYLGSDDENQRGRSKLGRWTSQKESNYSTRDKFQPLSSSSRAKEVEESIAQHFQRGEFGKVEGSSANDSDVKGLELDQFAESTRVERDWHFQSAAKLKMRSERFKLPMPGERGTLVNKKVENEVLLTLTEAAIEPGIQSTQLKNRDGPVTD